MQAIAFAVRVWGSAFAALLGLFMGSFLYCAGSRIAAGESFVKGRSHCGECGHTLAPRDLVPLFSWLFLRGRCRYCGGKISLRYPVSELICALVYGSIVFRYGLTLQTAELLLLFSLGLLIAFADLEAMVIPNALICVGIGLRLIFILLSDSVKETALQSVVGGLSVSLPLLLLVLLAEKCTHRSMMGGGDIKLVFMLGLYFSWYINLICFVFACFIGIVFGLLAGRRNKPFAFGPAIVAGWYIGLFFAQPLADFYLSLF